MKANWENFKGTNLQKDFAANITNSALALLSEKIENLNLKAARLTSEGQSTEKVEFRLDSLNTQKAAIEMFLSSGKPIHAKLIIENSVKEDATFKGWVINHKF